MTLRIIVTEERLTVSGFIETPQELNITREALNLTPAGFPRNLDDHTTLREILGRNVAYAVATVDTGTWVCWTSRR